MSVRVQQYVSWNAGGSTPQKYSFSIDAVTDIISQDGGTITLSLKGNATVSNHPTSSRNSWRASDFAVLTAGDKDPADYQFSGGTSYYKQGLPFLPNAPEDYTNAMVVEFRGDTYVGDGNNRSSLWTKDKGLVIDAMGYEETRTIYIDTTYTVTRNGQPNQPILIWQSSGANSSTDYSWLTRQVWVSLLDFDARPGMEYDCKSKTWQSVNKSTGKAKEFTGRVCSTLSDIKTGSSGLPASKLNGKAAYYWDCKNNRWSNQYKVGLNK